MRDGSFLCGQTPIKKDSCEKSPLYLFGRFCFSRDDRINHHNRSVNLSQQMRKCIIYIMNEHKKW